MTPLLKNAWTRTLPSVRLTFDFLAVLAIALAVLWLAVVMPITALAQEMPPGATKAPQIIHASTIDIDSDGQYDRAVLVRNPRTGDADLYIYLRAGGLTPMPARDFTRAPTPEEAEAERRAMQAIKDKTASDPTPVRPDIVKASITEGRVFDFEKLGQGSLIIQSGCGGCSNDTATRLTVVHRGGRFLIGGYAFTWDTRSGRGHCEINFLTGRGTLSVNGGKTKPLAGNFKPVRLADWRKDAPPKACAG
jgi:hypothetical protein